MMRLRTLIGLVILMFVVTSCAGLPPSSDVRPRGTVGSAAPRPVEVQPEQPAYGASPQAIAEGFLRAHIGLDDNFSVARQYLTDAASRRWQPAAKGIVILRDVNLTTGGRRGASRLTLSGKAQARVDKDGHLQQLANLASVSIPMEMTKVNGQWRISSLPADLGLWLDRTDFEDHFQQRVIYYAASGSAKVLVPDWRWLPENAGPTALATAVLQPPPSWLKPAVRTNLPDGLRLAASTVPISTRDRVATVALSKEALSMSPEARRVLWACMLITLRDSPGVQRVQLMVGTSRLVVPGLENEPLTEASTDYQVIGMGSSNAIVRSGDQLRWIDGTADRPRGAAQPPANATGPLPVINRNWYMLAANQNGDEIATVSGDRATLARWRKQAIWQRPPTFGKQLSRPAYDQFDGLWIAGQALSNQGQARPGQPQPAGPATVWVIDTAAEQDAAQPLAVSAPWLAGRDVVALAIAPEGKRVALAARDRKSGKTALYLSAVVRSNRQVVALTDPILVNPAVESVVDVTWTDDRTLAVIGRLRSSPTIEQPITVPVGGQAAEGLGHVAGAVAIVGGSDAANTVYLVTDRNSIKMRQGSSWPDIEVGQDIAVPVPSAGVDIPSDDS